MSGTVSEDRRPPGTALVVGAGLSGLTAAWRLQNAGFQTIVLEKDDIAGGRVRTVRQQGFVMDTGPDAISEGYLNYLALVRELGMGENIMACSTHAGVIRNGRIHSMDTASIWSMMNTRLLSWRAKLRLAIGVLRLRPLMKDLDNFQLVKSATLDDPSVSAEAFGLRHFGRENTDYLVDPLMRLVNGTGADDTTLLDLLGGLVAWSKPLVNILGGLDALPSHLAQQLDVRFGTEVTQVTQEPDGVSLSYNGPDGVAETLEADVCVISAMFDVVEKIYPSILGMAGDFGVHIRHIRLLSIQLGYDVATRSQCYAIQSPSCEYPEILLLFLQHHKAPDRAPAGHSLVTLYTDARHYDRLAALKDEKLVARFSSVVESLMPELQGHRVLNHVSRWPQAGYLAYPGYFRHAARMMENIPRNQRVQIAGDLFGAGSMESAVTWGNHAAACLIQNYG